MAHHSWFPDNRLLVKLTRRILIPHRYVASLLLGYHFLILLCKVECMELVAVVVEGLLTFVVVIHALVVVILLLGLEEARDDMVSGYRVNRMGQHSWQVVKGGRPWRD